MMQKNLFGILKLAEIRKRAYEAGIPIQATFELTPRCGFDCRMCYVHIPADQISKVGDGRELTKDEWLEIGRQAARMGVLSLCITGGDPILHPDFKEIWIGLSRLGFQMTLQTNASLLTEDILEVLDEYPPEMVKITLYGSNDDVYREVCRIEQGFTKTNAGIQALKQRHHNIQLVTTFIKQNRGDADNIARYARENQLPWYYSASCYPSLRGAKSETDTCAIEIWEKEGAKETSELWNKLPPTKEEKKPAQLCSGYRTAFNICWDGNMRFCLFLNEPHIQVLGKDLEICWRELLDYWESLRWPEDCYGCDYKKKCKRCIAHLACLSGGIGKLDKDYCRKIKQMIDIKRMGD